MSWWGGGEMSEMPNGVAGFGNHLVYLESRQLSSFSRLGALGHLYLNSSSAWTRYSAVTPKRPDAICLVLLQSEIPW